MKADQLLYKVLGVLGLLYLLNLGLGVIEFIPDNLPIVGNLDEAGIAYFTDGALFNGFFNKYITMFVSMKKKKR